jgi:PHD/YefM family antitoxin component YafN of YafNO toxin-antitoxin module
MRTDQAKVLAKMDQSPVVLAQRSRPRAVLVNIDQWNALAAELRRLRALAVADQRAREMKEDPTKRIPFTKEELIKRGVIDG